jgi:hypothetical protein
MWYRHRLVQYDRVTTCHTRPYLLKASEKFVITPVRKGAVHLIYLGLFTKRASRGLKVLKTLPKIRFRALAVQAVQIMKNPGYSQNYTRKISGQRLTEAQNLGVEPFQDCHLM